MLVFLPNDNRKLKPMQKIIISSLVIKNISFLKTSILLCILRLIKQEFFVGSPGRKGFLVEEIISK